MRAWRAPPDNAKGVCHHGPEPPVLWDVAADVAIRHGCAVVFAVVLHYASYFLFHVNKVHQCAIYFAHQYNDGILGIAGKLLTRLDNP